jgi:hypothetical protein
MTFANSMASQSSAISANRSTMLFYATSFTYSLPISYTVIHDWKVFCLSTCSPVGEFLLTGNPTITEQNLTLLGNTFGYGLYRIQYNLTFSLADGSQVTLVNNTFVNIVPSGIIVNILPNGASNATIGLIQELSLSPKQHSIEMDNFIDLTSLQYRFFCKLVPTDQAGQFFANESGQTDLASAKTSGTLPSNSCFNSTGE